MSDRLNGIGWPPEDRTRAGLEHAWGLGLDDRLLEDAGISDVSRWVRLEGERDKPHARGFLNSLMQGAGARSRPIVPAGR